MPIDPLSSSGASFRPIEASDAQKQQSAAEVLLDTTVSALKQLLDSLEPGSRTYNQVNTAIEIISAYATDAHLDPDHAIALAEEALGKLDLSRLSPNEMGTFASFLHEGIQQNIDDLRSKGMGKEADDLAEKLKTFDSIATNLNNGAISTADALKMMKEILKEAYNW